MLTHVSAMLIAQIRNIIIMITNMYVQVHFTRKLSSESHLPFFCWIASWALLRCFIADALGKGGGERGDSLDNFRLK